MRISRPTLLGNMMTIGERIIEMVKQVSDQRNSNKVSRRLLKIMEELGESAEAYLGVTSSNNYKNKTWDDLREESIDTLIVLIDVALTDTRLPNSTYLFAPAITTASLDKHPVDVYKMLCRVAGSVANTALHISEEDDIGALGSIVKGIESISRVVFMNAHHDDVMEIVERKLAKWQTHITATNMIKENEPK